jgi:AcrR family transcriptional regulator
LRGICPRKRRKDARPSEIVEAARLEFVARGFAASKVEEIAARAGVSKGTVYLYFPTKEALFEAVMRANVVPVIEGAAAMIATQSDVPAPVQLRFLLETMYRELVATDRRKLMHLIIAEGPHFPHLLEFYHREVVSRGMDIVRALVERGAARGEFDPRGMERHPKLIISPALLAALYANLFGACEPLDLEDYAQAHIASVMRALGASE